MIDYDYINQDLGLSIEHDFHSFDENAISTSDENFYSSLDELSIEENFSNWPQELVTMFNHN